jgi:hypothetical protein
MDVKKEDKNFSRGKNNYNSKNNKKSLYYKRPMRTLLDMQSQEF